MRLFFLERLLFPCRSATRRRFPHEYRIQPAVFRFGLVCSLTVGCLLYGGTWYLLDKMLEKEDIHSLTSRFESLPAQSLYLSPVGVFQRLIFPMDTEPAPRDWEIMELETDELLQQGFPDQEVVE